MSNITILPTELLEEIFSHLDNPSLLNCLYQNQKFFSLTIPLIWKNLGDSYWGAGPKTTLRWHLITNILLYSEKTFANYANFVQKIDLTCNCSPEYRVPKQTLLHLLVNGLRLKEITFQYHQEPLNYVEPFECLKEICSLPNGTSLKVLGPEPVPSGDTPSGTTVSTITCDDASSLQISTPPTTPPPFSSVPTIKAPLRKVTMRLYNVSPALIISLFAKYISTLEELILQIMYELSPLPYDDLKSLVTNNQNLKYMELYTIEGKRVFDLEMLNKFRKNGELPIADFWWTPELV